MSDSEQKYLDLFPVWLRGLGEDADQLGALIAETQLPEATRHALAGGINYLFKSLDLIPDGIDDVGYLDDAFVLRVSADLGSREDLSGADPDKVQILGRLAGECEVVREFLGETFERFEGYVKGLRTAAARGRTVADIVNDAPTREAFLSDVHGFASSYETPSFSREEKNLIKLRAFFDAKLPK